MSTLDPKENRIVYDALICTETGEDLWCECSLPFGVLNDTIFKTWMKILNDLRKEGHVRNITCSYSASKWLN